MKTTTILNSALLIGLAASIGFAQAPPSRSKWIPLPPKTATQSSPQTGGAAALIASLKAGKTTMSRDSASLQDRLALQQALPGNWLLHITQQGESPFPPFVVLIQFSSDGNFVD